MHVNNFEHFANNERGIFVPHTITISKSQLNIKVIEVHKREKRKQ